MIYSTGSVALDNLFGGYYPRVVHEIHGPTMAGKTTLSSYIPIGQIAKVLLVAGKFPRKGTFVVIDGDGGFDFERAQQVWEGIGINDASDIFDKLSYWQPTEFDDQHKLITTELEKTIKEKKITPLFIVADPLIAIYRGIILRTSMKFRMSVIGSYTGKLDLELTTLRRLAVTYNMPVVVSSWPGSPAGKAMGGPKGEVPMIGGRAFGFMPKVTLELSIPDGVPEESSIREASLFKHRSKPTGGRCYFKLSNKGVEDITEDDLEVLGVEE